MPARLRLLLPLLFITCSHDEGNPPDGPYQPPASARGRLELSDGWQFRRDDVPPADVGTLEDGRWAAVQLPHTWNAVDGQDGGNDYYRGPAWYRRRLAVPSAWAGRRLFLQFDGASTVTDVWINGAHLGQHRGGFATFRFEATAALHPGADNLLAVRVSNAAVNDVPPLAGDFTMFGGLYRGVSLLATAPVHIAVEDFGSSGVYVRTSNVTADAADLSVQVGIRNGDGAPHTTEARARLVDAQGRVVATLTGTTALAAGAAGAVSLAGSIARPHLWDGRRDPYLYTVAVELREGATVHDVVSVPFGFRSFAVTPAGGFSLNGRPYDLHGVARHQDRQDRGWAVTDADLDEDMALVDELGATAVRLVHYQHAQHVYDLADRAGVVVWTEVALVNAITHDPAFTANVRQQLQELIRQSYNHPSIMFWGLANEVVDFQATDPNPVVADLDLLAHAEDPSRPTTLASQLPDDFAINGQTDLVGFNKFYGWYSGKFSDLPTWLDAYHASHPDRSFALSEYGAGASPGLHTDAPAVADHSEEYQALFLEAYWTTLTTRPFVWAKFVTMLTDLASDARNEGDQPGRNDKGLVTYDRKIKKDAFYWFKANWSGEPFVHITSRRFEPRTTPTIAVKVYANLPTVALTVNGEALGAVSAPNHVFLWPSVALRPGANRVEATAPGLSAHDEVTWTLVPADDGGTASGPAAPLSNPCTGLANDGPAVSLMMPGGVVPPMTGGTLVDGTYVLTEVRNTQAPVVIRQKFKIRDGGTRVEHIEGAVGMPDRTAGGSVTTSGNDLIRGFICPGPTTLVTKYTATPTTIQLLSPNGPFTVFTRQGP